MQQHRLVVLMLLFAWQNNVPVHAEIIWERSGRTTFVSITPTYGLTAHSARTESDILDLAISLCRRSGNREAEAIGYQLTNRWNSTDVTGPLLFYDKTNTCVGYGILVPSRTNARGIAELQIQCASPKINNYLLPIATIITELYAPSVAQKGYLFNDGPLQAVELWSEKDTWTISLLHLAHFRGVSATNLLARLIYVLPIITMVNQPTAPTNTATTNTNGQSSPVDEIEMRLPATRTIAMDLDQKESSDSPMVFRRPFSLPLLKLPELVN